jgi:hypothetical protein
VVGIDGEGDGGCDPKPAELPSRKLTARGFPMRRWWYWFRSSWGTAARRAEMLAEAKREQDDERAAAIRRIIDTAHDWDGPTWGGPLYRAGR